MSTLEIVLRLTAAVLLILANAFFVAVEFGLTRLRQFSEHEIEKTGGLATAWAMTERLEIHLTGCQLGISSTSVVLGVVAEPAVTHVIRPIVNTLGFTGLGERTLATTSVVLSVIVLNLVHKIWGEQAPTYLGVERPLEVSRKLAPALAVWSRVMRPIIHMGDSLAKWTLRLFGVEMTRSWVARDPDEVSHGSLRSQLGELLSGGPITRDRQEEVIRTLEIGHTPVREIMIPRDEMVVLRSEQSWDEVLDAIAGSSYVRYPVTDGGDEEFVGLLYLPSLFQEPGRLRAGDIDLRRLAADPLFLDAETPVSEVIDRLQDAGQEAALIREEDRVIGMVTITDAFEEIAGDVEDPLD